MKKLVVLIGLPGSGKSTIANTEYPNHVIVSRDAIRFASFGRYVCTREEEDFVTKIQNTSVEAALTSGFDVVIDNVNLTGAYRKEFRLLAEKIGDVHYIERFINTPVDVCIERNKARERVVPDDVMAKFVRQAKSWYNDAVRATSTYFPPKTAAKAPAYDDNLADAVICDLDGTLCDLNGRNPYDPSTCSDDLPVYPVLDTLVAAYAAGKEIVFVSGRDEAYRNPTMAFLGRYCTFPFVLHMRPLNDTRPDTVVKKEIFNTHIRNKFNVAFVIDDRPSVVRMWRYELGLFGFQVNDKEF